MPFFPTGAIHMYIHKVTTQREQGVTNNLLENLFDPLSKITDPQLQMSNLHKLLCLA